MTPLQLSTKPALNSQPRMREKSTDIQDPRSSTRDNVMNNIGGVAGLIIPGWSWSPYI